MSVLATAVPDTIPIELRRADELIRGDVYWRDHQFWTMVKRETFGMRTNDHTYERVRAFPSSITDKDRARTAMQTMVMRSHRIVAVAAVR